MKIYIWILQSVEESSSEEWRKWYYLQVISLEILIQGAKKNLKIKKTVFSRKMAM